MSHFELQQMKQLASDEEVHELEEDIPVSSAQNHGNLVIFLSGKIHLSLGPDYCFTIFALVFLAVIAYALYNFQTMLHQGTLGRAINVFFVGLPPISFLMTALGNPGIYNPYENDDPKIKYCETCKVFKPKKVFHCQRCNVCIEGFDHHCPWMSKCIGKKNLKSFYTFILSLPLAFFYFGFMIYIAATQQQTANQK